MTKREYHQMTAAERHASVAANDLCDQAGVLETKARGLRSAAKAIWEMLESPRALNGKCAACGGAGIIVSSDVPQGVDRKGVAPFGSACGCVDR